MRAPDRTSERFGLNPAQRGVLAPLAGEIFLTKSSSDRRVPESRE